MFEVNTRHVPARRVMSIQRRLHGDQTEAFVRDAKAVFGKHLNGANATGPFTLIFHGQVNADEDGPIEAIIGCPDDVLPTDLIGVRTEPAHDEAYTPIAKAQWDYPAILAAYDAVACSSEVAARPNSPLSLSRGLHRRTWTTSENERPHLRHRIPTGPGSGCRVTHDA